MYSPVLRPCRYLLFNHALVGLNDTDRIVGYAMIDYWQSFAAGGNPSPAGSTRPVWPSYSPGNTTMLLDITSSAVQNLHQVRKQAGTSGPCVVLHLSSA